MSYNLNLKKILIEASEIADEKAMEFDTILAKNDLEKMFNDIDPISGAVAEKLQESAANPEALRIVAGMDENAHSVYYMDYNELANYMEATQQSCDDAVRSICEAYHDEPMNINNFYIVFSSKKAFLEAANEELEANRKLKKLGYDSDINWSSHFMCDCKNKGLKVATFIDPDIQ